MLHSQITRKLHEDLRILVLEKKIEIEGLHKSYTESQKAISILETRIKKHEGKDSGLAPSFSTHS
jgi:predicted  nucleic acid-binding Zn-ribbon protein